MKKLSNFSRGMGIGGWLTNYKRFNVLPENHRMVLTVGDMEHFETYMTEADVKNIKNMGMDHIRLGFDQIVVESEPYVYREQIFELLDAFASWCEAYDLRLVLNLHKAIGNYCDIPEKTTLFDSPPLKSRFIALWLEMEKRFSRRTNVMFELLNEVRDIEPAAWNSLYTHTVSEIRKLNPTRDIIIGTVCWNSCDHLKDLSLINDDHVHYTFHVYSPFEFTHQRGVLQPQTLYYNRALSYPCDDMERYRDFYRVNAQNVPYPADMQRMDKAYLYAAMAGATDFVKQHPDKILWCGEFGTIRHTDIASRVNWMRDVIAICKEYDIPYCVWNYLSTPNDGNRFSLVDDDTREILSPALLTAIRGE